MIDFFVNIGQWIWQQRETLLMVFTSGQFVSLLTSLILLVRNLKSNKATNLSSKDLKKTIEDNNVVVTNSEEAKTNTELLLAMSKKLDESLAAYEKKNDATLALQTEKMNVVLEVMGIVYSTIKDEKVRSTVNNLLTNARYNETATRAELQRQVNELKATVAAQLKTINETVEAGVQSVSEVISVQEESTDVPMRY